VLSSKGCVARCTFCHRWDKGYRTYPLDGLLDTIKQLRQRWNVGFFRIADENFGSDRRYTDEFIARIRPLDVLFDVAGVRVATVDNNPKLIRRLKDAGCCAMFFGMETGSPKMLSVMEKKALAEQNLRVAKLLNQEGMYTIIQFVLGMPGENNQTIEESVRFACASTEDMNEVPLERMSLNLFQALPGTPGYEFVRAKGLIGPALEDEEAYLLKVSDVDACSPEHYVNVSESPLEDVLLWRSWIAREAIIHYYKKRRWKPPPAPFEGRQPAVKDYARGGYFRILQMGLMNSVWYWRLEDLFRGPLRALRHLRARVQVHGLRKGLALQVGLRKPEDRSRFVLAEPKSLRKIIQRPGRESVSRSEASMIPLRSGR
jgi:radical SAM superfamily enzyme YgiQ (UPF0313 family)